MKQADITYQVHGDTFGKDRTYTNWAIQKKLPAKQAGEFVRALGELPHLTTNERHERFCKVVNWP
jgi:hypothetical protein